MLLRPNSSYNDKSQGIHSLTGVTFHGVSTLKAVLVFMDTSA
jgi:hypothetical protein